MHGSTGPERMADATPHTETTNDTDNRWQRWQERWKRYGWLVAIFSFGLGLASFLLIERQEKVAQGLIILLPLSWLAMLAEDALERWEKARNKMRMSPLVLLRIGVQQVHQESFFFTLPFFLATTNWRTPQCVFTSLLIVAGLLSMVDPLYHHRLAPRRWAYFGFHALSVFITVLTAGPMLWQMTTTQSLQLAGVCMALLSIPAAARALEPGTRKLWHWPLIISACTTLGMATWIFRWAIPPSTLWVNQARVSYTVDAATREPGEAAKAVLAGDVQSHGLYAWTAIRAPRGLHEEVVHRWMQNGHEVDRIPLQIAGGRKEGYRAWSYKHGFPADARGDWDIQVITEGGQLIGVIKLTIK
jgi:hypothetical protein